MCLGHRVCGWDVSTATGGASRAYGDVAVRWKSSGVAWAGVDVCEIVAMSYSAQHSTVTAGI